MTTIYPNVNVKCETVFVTLRVERVEPTNGSLGSLAIITKSKFEE